MNERSAQRVILYQQEVLGFLRDFVYPQAMAPGHKPPQGIEDVMDDAEELWEELEGFTSPLALRKTLLAEYLNDAREDDILALVDLLGEMRYSNLDPMTDYMRKSELGIMTGLAHLYAKVTDTPCAIIEVDFSNMGGTNAFFQDLIAKAEGVEFDAVDPRRGEALTDDAVKICAQIILQEIRKSQSHDSVILPIRAGGDELRVICTDIEPAEFPKMQKRIHHQIEMEMAHLGLMNHEHAKHPGNAVKCGFGAALAIQDLRHVEPDTYAEIADAKIDIEKVLLGHYRAGKMPPQELILKSAFAENLRAGDAPEYSAAERCADTVHIRHAAYKRAMDMAGTGPDNTDAALRLRNITTAMRAALWRTDYEDEKSYQTAIFEDDDAPFDLSGTGYNPQLLYMSVAEEYEWKLVRHLSEMGLDTDDYELDVLHAALMGLTAEDPATGVSMPRDMPRQLEIYMRDLEAHLPHLSSRLEDEMTRYKGASGPIGKALAQAGYEKSDLAELTPMMMGIGFHNLAGLNKVFGHDNANKALSYIAQKIVRESLQDHGFGVDDYAIAHEGGGQFTILFKPVIEDRDGFVTIPGRPQLQEIAEDIQYHMDVVNEQPITAFMTQLGMVLQDDTALTAHNVSMVADIPDQKNRPWMDGLRVSSTIQPVDKAAWDSGQTRTGHHLYELRHALEDKVEADRAVYKALYIDDEPPVKTPVKPRPAAM